MKKQILILVSLFAIISSGYAQTPEKKDTVAASHAADQAVDLIVKERLQRLTDSISQAALALQIENTSEIKKRHALEQELDKKREADSLRLANLHAQITKNKQNAIGYPMVVGGDTIRVLFSALGSFTPAERAALGSEKIMTAAGTFVESIDSIIVVNDGVNLEVMFRDQVLTTITQADAMWHDADQMAFAQRVATNTRQAIIQYKEQTSILTIAKQIGLSLLVIAMCYLLIRFINRSFRGRINRLLLSKVGTWFKGWNIRDYQLMNPQRQVKFTLLAITIFRWTLTILILYFALPILFSIFPMTQRLADTLFGWVLSPVKTIFWAVVKYIPDMFVILVIATVMRYVVRGAKYIMNEISVGNLKIPGFYADWAKATYNIIRMLLYAFTFVMIFPYLPGSDSDIFKGVSVFLGIIVSLGSSSAIANMVAGLVITYMRPFKIGDHIKIGEITGDVTEKTPFVTRIKTYKQEVVTIPNSTILSASVINYSTSAADTGIIFHTTITIGYDVPWRKIHQMMIEAALRSQYIVADPAPYVLQTSLDDFYVSYQLCAYSRNPEKQARIYSELHQNIQDIFNENDIEIMSPHYRAERDGNETTVPVSYRPKTATISPQEPLTNEKKL